MTMDVFCFLKITFLSSMMYQLDMHETCVLFGYREGLYLCMTTLFGKDVRK